MKLYKLDYKQHFGSSKVNPWEIKDLILGDLNLIVGKNAVGKSKTINVINNTALLITEKIPLKDGAWFMEFMNEEEKFIYELELENGIVKKEKIICNGNEKLDRNPQKTRIFSNKINDFIEINPPVDKLLLHIRRDKDEHPFLEFLFDWAKGVRGFKFGDISPNRIFEVPKISTDISS